MTQQRLRTHNMVGVFRGRGDALRALDRLRDTDLDPGREISLLGPDIEMRPGDGRFRERRGGAMTGLGSGLLTGAMAGTLGGVLLMIVAVAAVPLDMGWLPALALGAAIGASGGGTVGALLGVEAAGRRAAMWQQTLSPLLHRVHDEHVTLLGVHVDDQPENLEANLGDRIPSGHPDASGHRDPGLRTPGVTRA